MAADETRMTPAPHVKARREKAAGYPERFPVPDRLVDWDVARLFLLDGTELGSLAGIKAAQCSQEAKPARKGKKIGKG